MIQLKRKTRTFGDVAALRIVYLVALVALSCITFVVSVQSLLWHSYVRLSEKEVTKCTPDL